MPMFKTLLFSLPTALSEAAQLLSVVLEVVSPAVWTQLMTMPHYCRRSGILFLCKRLLPPPNQCKTAAQTGNRFKWRRRERRATLLSLQCEDVRQSRLRSIAPYSLHIVIHVLQSITDLSCSFAKAFKASSASAVQPETNKRERWTKENVSQVPFMSAEQKKVQWKSLSNSELWWLLSKEVGIEQENILR